MATDAKLETLRKRLIDAADAALSLSRLWLQEDARLLIETQKAYWEQASTEELSRFDHLLQKG